MKHIKELLKDSSVYGIGTVISKLFPFFLIPLYTRLLTLAEYGNVLLLLAISTILQIFISLAMDNGIYRYYYDAEDEKFRKEIISSWMFMQLAISIVIIILGILFVNQIGDFFAPVANIKKAIILAFITLPFISLINTVKHVYRINRNPLKSVFIDIGDLFIFTVITSILLLNDYGVLSPFIGMFTSKFIISIVAIIIEMYKYFSFTYYSSALLRKVFIYSWPFLPGILAWWVLSGIDRILIASIIDARHLAYYGVARNLIIPFTLFYQAIQTAFGPYAMSIKDTEDAKEVYSDLYESNLYFLGLLAGILAYFSPWLVKFIATDLYIPSLYVMPFLLLGSLASYSYGQFSIGLGLEQKTKYIALAIGVGSVVNVVLNILLIPTFGIVGASFTNFASLTICAVLILVYCRRYYVVPYPFKKIIFFVLFTIIALVIYLETLDHTVINFYIRTGLILTQLVVSTIMGRKFLKYLIIYFMNKMKTLRNKKHT